MCIAVAALLLGSIGRGPGRAVDWLVDNLDRFEALDERLGGRLRDPASFTVVALVFVALGLLEVASVARRLERSGRPELGALVLRASAVLATKLRRYVLWPSPSPTCRSSGG